MAATFLAQVKEHFRVDALLPDAMYEDATFGNLVSAIERHVTR